MTQQPPRRLLDDPSVAAQLRGDLVNARAQSSAYDPESGLAALSETLDGLAPDGPLAGRARGRHDPSVSSHDDVEWRASMRTVSARWWGWAAAGVATVGAVWWVARESRVEPVQRGASERAPMQLETHAEAPQRGVEAPQRAGEASQVVGAPQAVGAPLLRGEPQLAREPQPGGGPRAGGEPQSGREPQPGRGPRAGGAPQPGRVPPDRVQAAPLHAQATRAVGRERSVREQMATRAPVARAKSAASPGAAEGAERSAGASTATAPPAAHEAASSHEPDATARLASTAPSARSTAPQVGMTEVEHLAGVRRLLATEPQQALVAARDGQKMFADGVFVEERAGLIVFALADLGHTDDALSEGRRFLRAHPDGPFAARVRAIVARIEDGAR